MLLCAGDPPSSKEIEEKIKIDLSQSEMHVVVDILHEDKTGFDETPEIITEKKDEESVSNILLDAEVLQSHNFSASDVSVIEDQDAIGGVSLGKVLANCDTCELNTTAENEGVVAEACVSGHNVSMSDVAIKDKVIFDDVLFVKQNLETDDANKISGPLEDRDVLSDVLKNEGLETPKLDVAVENKDVAEDVLLLKEVLEACDTSELDTSIEDKNFVSYHSLFQERYRTTEKDVVMKNETLEMTVKDKAGVEGGSFIEEVDDGYDGKTEMAVDDKVIIGDVSQVEETTEEDNTAELDIVVQGVDVSDIFLQKPDLKSGDTMDLSIVSEEKNVKTEIDLKIGDKDVVEGVSFIEEIVGSMNIPTWSKTNEDEDFVTGDSHMTATSESHATAALDITSKDKGMIDVSIVKEVPKCDETTKLNDLLEEKNVELDVSLLTEDLMSQETSVLNFASDGECAVEKLSLMNKVMEGKNLSVLDSADAGDGFVKDYSCEKETSESRDTDKLDISAKYTDTADVCIAKEVSKRGDTMELDVLLEEKNVETDVSFLTENLSSQEISEIDLAINDKDVTEKVSLVEDVEVKDLPVLDIADAGDDFKKETSESYNTVELDIAMAGADMTNVSLKKQASVSENVPELEDTFAIKDLTADVSLLNEVLESQDNFLSRIASDDKDVGEGVSLMEEILKSQETRVLDAADQEKNMEVLFVVKVTQENQDTSEVVEAVENKDVISDVQVVDKVSESDIAFKDKEDGVNLQSSQTSMIVSDTEASVNLEPVGLNDNVKFGDIAKVDDELHLDEMTASNVSSPAMQNMQPSENVDIGNDAVTDSGMNICKCFELNFFQSSAICFSDWVL